MKSFLGFDGCNSVSSSGDDMDTFMMAVTNKAMAYSGPCVAVQGQGQARAYRFILEVPRTEDAVAQFVLGTSLFRSPSSYSECAVGFL